MSYSGSGAVATLWSPTNYNGATKIPVPSTTRRYSTTSSTSTYRSSGSQERSYYGSTSNTYTSSSRNVQAEYRHRYSTPIRSSASVPTSYSSRLAELHDTTSRLTSKERSEATDSLLSSSYRRSSKTDSDVAATLEKYGLKSDSYRLRNDSMPNRFLNTANLDTKYSTTSSSSATSRKLSGSSTLELPRLGAASKPPKSALSSRLQRKDSLTKSETADAGLSPIASLERKSSSSAVGGSSSPIDIRKTEVWDKKLSVSYGAGEVGSDEAGPVPGRHDGDESGNAGTEPDAAETEEEKALTFDEIRKKFDGSDGTTLRGGYESGRKSSQDESRSSISNGVILGVHNFGQVQASRGGKSVDEAVAGNGNGDRDQDGAGTPDEGNSDDPNDSSSPQTLRRAALKPIPSSIKPSNSSSVLRKSPDSGGESVGSLKKRSSSDLKKGSPEKKEGGFGSSLGKLSPMGTGEVVASSSSSSSAASASTTTAAAAAMARVTNVDSVAANVIEVKREARNACINSKLGVDTRADLRLPPKLKGEKLLTKVEQTLSKAADVDGEVLGSLTRLRRSPPDPRPKDHDNPTKVFELRRLEATLASPFEADARKVRDDVVDVVGDEGGPTDSSVRKIAEGAKGAGPRGGERTTGTAAAPGRGSPVKEHPAARAVGRETVGETTGHSEAVKPVGKGGASPKDEKDYHNARERDLGKKATVAADDLTKEAKHGRDNVALAKEMPIWDKHDMSANLNNRTFPSQASTSHNANAHAYNERVDNLNLTGTSPRSSVAKSRNSSGEKGGLNGLKNIGNTCFMNSVLQCLSNTKPLLEYLLNEEYMTDINFTISAMKGSLIKAFSNVIQELWAVNAEDRIINTTNFKSQIQKFAPRFMGYAQQDAQEFLRYLLEGLHEDVNRVTVKPQQILTDIDDSLSDNQKATEAWKRYLRMDDSKVVDIFVGQLKSTLQCTVCGHCSVTFDPFWDLSLPVPSRTGQPRLQSCLDAFTKEEVLDGEEKPTCSKCETRRKCTKSFSIQKFPKILVLHLKRFSPTERYRGKLSITVDFPLTSLDLSPYAANKGQGCTYNLYAISNHSGTAYGGHYTAYCKHPYTGNWHEYNDSRVSSLSSRSVVSGEAYVLFYELATQTSHL